MTAIVSSTQLTAIRRAAVRATLAPSVHNTQPWQLHIVDGHLDVYAERARRLPVLDPTMRQLLISCGCAIMNARVSLAGDGFEVVVDRSAFPKTADPIASLTTGEGLPDPALAQLNPAIEQRQTNRRPFAPDPVPDHVIDAIEMVAGVENSELFVVRDADQRAVVAALSQKADSIENLNPAYRAELRAWTSDDPGRSDGVLSHAVPHVDGSEQDTFPVRDFDTRGTGGLPAGTRSPMNQCLALLCTRGDSPAEWLRAGEALERVLLELTRQGYVASPLTQVTEVPVARAQLRQELRMTGYPHVLLRIGRAPASPASRRRRLAEVIREG